MKTESSINFVCELTHAWLHRRIRIRMLLVGTSRAFNGAVFLRLPYLHLLLSPFQGQYSPKQKIISSLRITPFHKHALCVVATVVQSRSIPIHGISPLINRDPASACRRVKHMPPSPTAWRALDSCTSRVTPMSFSHPLPCISSFFCPPSPPLLSPPEATLRT